MNSYEEELQRNIEAGKPVKGEDADVKAYQEVFRALKTAPATSLPHYFADKVVARVLEKQKRESKKDIFWFCAGMVFLVVALMGTIFYTGFKIDMGFLKEMSGYSGLLIFAVSFITLLNWLDKRLVLQKRM
jgi:hypothetical protein